MPNNFSMARIGQITETDSFFERYNTCSEQVISFVGEVGIKYDGCRILDIGSGDGVIDLAIANRTGCEITGIDINLTDKENLILGASAHGVSLERGSINFGPSSKDLIDIEDEYFDHAFSRDVFEHVYDPISLLKAAHRVLKPAGTLCIQIWPLWHSEWGAHLFERQAPWEHLVSSREDILNRWDGIWQAKDSYDSCARTSVDDLQRACLAAGFRAVRVELVAPVFSPSEFADHLRWTEMGIAGIKVLLQK